MFRPNTWLQEVRVGREEREGEVDLVAFQVHSTSGYTGSYFIFQQVLSASHGV